MGFLRIFLVFIIATFLSAADFSNFDRNFDLASKAEKEVFHKELRSIYIEAMTKGTKSDKIAVLERLIHSSKALGLNFKGYENDLKSLGGSYDRYLNSKVSPKKERSIQADTQPKKQVVLDQNFVPEVLDFTEDKPIKKVQKTESPSKIETPLEKNPPLDDNVTLKQLNLMSVDRVDGGVVLNFNRPLVSGEMRQFVLDNNAYRNVVDFKAGNYATISKIEGSGASEIRIAQYNPKIARVVFTDSKKFDILIKSDGKTVTITSSNLTKAINQTPKVAEIKKPTKKENIKSKESVKKEPAKVIKKESIKKATTSYKPRLIVIDPGHGGKDPGTMGAGLKEKDIVLNIGKDLGAELTKRGYKIAYTRTTDKFISLRNRTAFANKKDADLFISIHVNAGPNKNSKLSGVETFFLSPARSERSKNAAALENRGDIEDMNYFSQQTYLNFLNREKIIASNKLAIDIQKHILNRVQNRYNMKDSGVREAPFWVLVGATMPAILIEVGYITSKNDSKHLGKRAYQKDVANGIANGIDAYFLKN
ncbi:N-acetylmuramoyl-L-alanine amidase family protein [Campylobacter corcagiensis]|uniref:N-acetylmuramoyl-L-alanine amidase n=1 Tax=Campylobacter corcagiensis TaxID=1448857 RepID=A0A7M1LH62_9BACT|nr:N-acetylmuramoyl-L-alanine amidase [Campylobacter corcagiensis]QKF64440.1 N-acetylmuramoyl-L-alanine amidase [Campylobacter corcagiensis]QOQ87374.1 N-acetylmuramoyl-L-alanine amidase [Campylobacter corcagiensis]